MNIPIALSTPGWPEILVILLIVLVLFGAKRLPELARGIAQSLNEFKKAKSEFDKEIKQVSSEVENVQRDVTNVVTTKEPSQREAHRQD